MALEYDGQRIGAMQYNGVTIGEAMIDGHIVYRSVIRVTPTAPTFHDGEPWITLPTVEGVTYSVSGTPGYNASVTVTATAQPGYELAGQTSWTHTYGPPPSIYPVSGSWGPATITNWVSEYAAHTIQSAGQYTISHTVTRAEAGSVAASLGGPWGFGPTVTGTTSATVTTVQTLAVGDVVTFRAGTNSTGAATGSGSWSIVKN